MFPPLNGMAADEAPPPAELAAAGVEIEEARDDGSDPAGCLKSPAGGAPGEGGGRDFEAVARTGPGCAPDATAQLVAIGPC